MYPTKPAQMIESINRDRPGLYRLAAAASLAGMTVESFAAGCTAGTIPCEIVKISERLRFVRSEQFTSWLKGESRT